MRGEDMTYSMNLGNGYKLMFSDSNFKPMRKKPTISIYDAEHNIEQKKQVLIVKKRLSGSVRNV